MFKFIRSLFIVLICMSYGAAVSAQDAAILPPAKTTFFTNDGKPLTGGKVYFYVPNTSTLKNTWQDANQSVVNANPVVLDASGRAIIFGDGDYRQVVRDRNNNLIWDGLTSSTGSGGSGSTTGDGDLVGTIKPWAGLIAPSQYLFAYGQEISRSTYSVLFTAVTLSTSAFCNNGSPILTGLSDTTQIPIGASVEISCMAPGTTILSKTSNSVTTTNNSSLTTSTTAVFLPWGGGNGSTTFNLPDLRGRTIAGRNNMGGTASSRLTTTYYGTNPDATGAAGGFQSKTLSSSELPITGYQSVVTDPGHNHTLLNSGVATGVLQVGAGTGSGNTYLNYGSVGSGTLTISSSLTHVTVATTVPGGGNAFSIVQPTITSNYIIKVTPDTVGTTNIGVTAIQGMTGDISCGSGLLCTGNVISVNATTLPGGLNTQIQFNDNGLFGGSTNLTWVSPKLTIGLAGSVTGQLAFTNTTSGSITLQSATGALGSSVLTLPAATDTFAVLAASQALTNKTYNGLTLTSTTGTFTLANGKTLTYNNSITIAGTDSTTMTFPSNNANITALNIASQNITGGVIVTSQSISTGSYTVDCGSRPLQYITNGGAFTLTAPSNDGSCILLVTNNGSAGSITFSGFSVGSNTGDALSNNNTYKFSIHIWRVNGTSGYRIAAHQ